MWQVHCAEALHEYPSFFTRLFFVYFRYNRGICQPPAWIRSETILFGMKLGILTLLRQNCFRSTILQVRCRTYMDPCDYTEHVLSYTNNIPSTLQIAKSVVVNRKDLSCIFIVFFKFSSDCLQRLCLSTCDTHLNYISETSGISNATYFWEVLFPHFASIWLFQAVTHFNFSCWTYKGMSFFDLPNLSPSTWTAFQFQN